MQTTNGHGFPWLGPHNHTILTEMRLRPVVLKDRIASRRSTLSLDLTDARLGLEMMLPLVQPGG